MDSGTPTQTVVPTTTLGLAELTGAAKPCPCTGKGVEVLGMTDYGSQCKAWDKEKCEEINGRPTGQFCCESWCYVDKDCASGWESSVSTGKFFSYAACQASSVDDGKCPYPTAEEKKADAANETNATAAEPPTQDIPEEEPAKEEDKEMEENNIDAEMKLNVDFQFVQQHQDAFVNDFVSDLAKTLNCSKDKVLVTGIESGSVIVKFTILNNAKKEVSASGREETVPPAVLIKQLQQKAEDNEIKFTAIETLTRKPVVSEVTKAVVVGDPNASKVHCRNCGQVSDVNAKKK